MSKMYGKRRVVLEQKPRLPSGSRLVVVCGSNGQGGLYAPLGYWYEEAGLFYVDLKSPEQWYSSLNRESIANKRLGGLPTKQALREYVMKYWLANGVV